MIRPAGRVAKAAARPDGAQLAAETVRETAGHVPVNRILQDSSTLLVRLGRMARNLDQFDPIRTKPWPRGADGISPG